jgi:starch phosphorylase
MSNVKDKAVKVSSLAGTLVEVELLVNGLNPNAVRVELFVDAISGGESIRQEMKWTRTLAAELSRCVYQATIPTTRPASQYTARVIPQRARLGGPLEFGRILWQR